MNCIIETTDLTKKFIQSRNLAGLFLHSNQRTRVTLAINNINLQVKESELFGLIGPNGAGKTTLIKILCCLILPTEGRAKVAGCDILDDEKKVKASVGLINGDERSFYWRLTGRQNLQFFASLYNLSPAQIKLKIKELIDFLEIREPDKMFHEYSTGMRQKLAIARSFLNDPQILFMDEPTKGLDPLAACSLRKFIKEELVGKHKKTVFFATHNLEDVNELADRIAFINRGEIKEIRTISELRQEAGYLRFNMEEIFRQFTE